MYFGSTLFGAFTINKKYNTKQKESMINIGILRSRWFSISIVVITLNLRKRRKQSAGARTLNTKNMYKMAALASLLRKYNESSFRMKSSFEGTYIAKNNP
jgi:hypothetical protein